MRLASTALLAFALCAGACARNPDGSPSRASLSSLWQAARPILVPVCRAIIGVESSTSAQSPGGS